MTHLTSTRLGRVPWYGLVIPETGVGQLACSESITYAVFNQFDGTIHPSAMFLDTDALVDAASLIRVGFEPAPQNTKS